MITANVIRAIQEVLKDRGIEQRQDEKVGDYVARGLDITDAQAEKLLACLHDGARLEEAEAASGIVAGSPKHGLLVELARVIGSTIGRVAS